MPFYADLHVHSRFSRATSKDCDLEELAWWAARKGITVLGTGDFTHPAWFDELRANLVPAEPGLFRLRGELERALGERLPAPCRRPVRFMLSVEISTIYKRDDRTRKVHHLLYAPDFDAAAAINTALARIGNLGSDGRPILGLDSRDLLDITLSAGDGTYLVPAHVWTPWFAVLGSMSGFDAVEDCYADLAGHIFAVETGLSSDPAMNWRVSGLDRYRLVSNSDAHSPPALGREATVFDTEVDYFALRHALETGEGFGGTVEFFPEEGKYHLDGHRKCGVRLEPAETRRRDRACPVCGKPVTVGVMHRVEALADREPGLAPDGVAPFRCLVQLPQVIGELAGVGPRTKTVQREVSRLVAKLGPELDILEHVDVAELRRAGSAALAEAIERLRAGRVIREAGYDGEYGVIRLFAPHEIPGAATGALFELDEPVRPPAEAPAAAPVAQPAPPAPAPVPDGLDPEQRAAVAVAGQPLLIVAGPGTGKTRTLAQRFAHLVGELHVAPERCLAITFTRKAAAELRERLAALLGAPGARIPAVTFHRLALDILREQYREVGFAAPPRVSDSHEAEVARHEHGCVDLDELVPLAAEALRRPDVAATYRQRWSHVAVDEYQDIDAPQYRLLRRLTQPDGDVCVIGDPDQAIYSFRGGDVSLFQRFEQDFPAARVVRLYRNYRSTPAIVQAALGAIRPSSLVPGRRLEAVHPETPESVVVHEAASEAAEAEFVVASIERMIGGSSYFALDSGRVEQPGEAQLSFADIAVLARTSAQLDAIEEALDRTGLPAQRREHGRLADDPAVGLLSASLRQEPGSGPIGERLEALVAAAAEQGQDLARAAELLRPLADRCGADLDRFLAELALGAQVDTLDPRADAIALLTLHASKGLEFPVVFITGCEEGLLPLRWGSAEDDVDGETLVEERRLFFVGLTRARQRLLLSYAGRRMRHGRLRDARPSRFLGDLDPALVERSHWQARRTPRPDPDPSEQLQLL